MIKATKTITPLLAYMMLMLAIGMSNHVFILPMLLQSAYRDAPLSVLFTLPALVLWAFLLGYIVKKIKGQSIHIWVGQQYGTLMKYIITAFIWIYFFLIAYNTLFETTTWANSTYLPLTPRFVTLLTLTVLCLFCALSGLRVMAITSGVLLPAVIIFGYYVMSVNFQFKNYSLLFPLLEFGWKQPLYASHYAMAGMMELIVILFFQEKLSPSMKTKGLLIMTFLLVGLIIGPLMGGIAIYGPYEAAQLRFPAFEQWRMVELGPNLSHIDFFSIYQWLAGSFIRISLALYLLVELWRPATKKKRISLFIGISVLLYILLVMPISDMKFMFFLRNFYFPVSFVFLVMLTMLFVLLIYIKNRRGDSHDSKKNTEPAT